MTFIEERESLRQQQGATIPFGEVMVTLEGSTRDTLGRRYEARNVIVGDESDRNPELRQAYFDRTSREEALIKNNPQWGWTHLGKEIDGEEEGKLCIDPNNIPARNLYFKDGDMTQPTQMGEWGLMVMQAKALEALQNPITGGRFLPQGRNDRRTSEYFTYTSDGIGLRSRQHIYSELLVNQALNTPSDKLRIASLGSGASVPNVEASLRIEKEIGKYVEWFTFDIDPDAISGAEMVTNDADLQRTTFDFGPKSNDPKNPGYLGRSYIEVRNAIEDESLDAVDALGLWEYLSDNQAVMFLKMMYKKLKPGASMIVSNMRKKRPNPNYTMVAVGWPAVIMRTDEDLLNIVTIAEIPTEQVRLTTPKDGVYVVMEIRKP